nr:myb/SANT-like domain, Harbinger transposase-derived nuclease domain protein [Tanacetum cinerariifolium]GEY90249.1 myb/SANT-like domain, Harbinger transposase-derived nuclease domain protein [Tanacetum cinerariifolium]
MIKVLLDTCIEEMKLTGMNGTSLHRQSWVRLGKAIDIWASTSGASASRPSASRPSTSGPSASGALASRASASEASTYRASTIRERVRELDIDDDPLVDVAVDDDDDDGNSLAHKIHDKVQPKKKAKTDA